MSWETLAKEHWEWRAGARPHGLPIPPPLAKLIRSPVDLPPFLAQIRNARQPIPQAFLDSRPSYMSKEPPAALVGRTALYALFEQLLEMVPSTVSLTITELDELFSPYADLPELVAALPTLKSNLLWAQTIRRRKAASHFRRVLEPELVAAVYHPRRIERLIDQYGMEALDSLGA
jgi:hypothetical protein